MKTVIGGAERETAQLRESILNAGDRLAISGSCYYLSNDGDDSNDGLSPRTPWATPDKLHSARELLKYGDAVLFERGSIFRIRQEIVLVDGVSYGAYGSGKKPEIWGSDRNYADAKLWSRTATENVWVLELPTSSFVGNIVFNLDESVGWLKPELSELHNDADFYFEAPERKLYLYSSAGNPGDIFTDIEACVRIAPFYGLMDAHDITIDNLCIKYTGAGGIEFNYGGISDITVTNCEIGWTGGSYLWDGSKKVRGGNGIGCYNNVRRMKISHNWVYQDYDAGISPQGDPGMIAEDIEISENLIEYCTWSYEQWVGNSEGMMRNNFIRDNIMRMSGYGWSAEQRPDPEYDSHFNAWSYHLTGCFDNYQITNNIFDCSAQVLVAWHWEKGEPEHEGLFISGNTFYQKANKKNLAMWYGYSDSYNKMLTKAYSQEDLEKAVKPFDNNPKLIKWLG